MSHGHGHKFYKTNLTLFLQLFFYKYKIPLILFVILTVLLIILINVLPGPQIVLNYQFHLTIVLAASILVGLVSFLGGILWKAMYLTGYSMAKETEELVEQFHEIQHEYGGVYKKLLMKLFIAWLLLIVISFGALVYFNIL